MGTGLDAPHDNDLTTAGVVPRAAEHIFAKISELKQVAVEAGEAEPSFEVGVQFVEIYNEEIADLLAEERATTKRKIDIREDERNEIFLEGVGSQPVHSAAMIMEVLRSGVRKRATAATSMNQQSSRSHAIFSIFIKQQRIICSSAGDSLTARRCSLTVNTSTVVVTSESEVTTAKFHFVDLAGSERLKKSNAVGERAKEAISINSGLLALGNVINALGKSVVLHVPYRDSKLTRLLQDSLGGNSRTLMIACVSPSMADHSETVGTLEYADRAKSIKNKAVVNQRRLSILIGGESTTPTLVVRYNEEAQPWDLRNQIGHLTREIAKLKTQNAKHEELKRKAIAIEEENSRLKIKVRDLEAMRHGGETENVCASHESQIDDLQKQIELLRGENAQLQQNGPRIRELERDLKRADGDRADALAELQDLKTRCNFDKVRSVEVENARLQIKLRMVEAVEQEKKTQIALYETQHDDLRKHIVFLTSENEKHQTEIASASSKFNELKEKADEDEKIKKAETLKLKERCESVEQARQLLESKNTQLREEKEILQKERDDHLDDLRKQIEYFKNEKANLDNLAKVICDYAASGDVAHVELKSVVKRLENHGEGLKAGVDKLEGNRKQMEDLMRNGITR